MKFEQLKVWPTRRVHLFQGGAEISFCGLAWRMAGDKIGEFDWEKKAGRVHPYDNLNFCQSCRRKAMSWHNQKYKPLTQKYDHLRKAWEKKKAELEAIKERVNG